jgi:hypothetical protein
MRTTYGEICLFNDDLFQHETAFIFNGKKWGIGSGGGRKKERERGSKCEGWRVGEEGF